MAKRKRLTPLGPGSEADTAPAGLETKSFPSYPLGVHPPTPRAPISQVAGDAATQSALNALSDELSAAKSEGRMVVKVPLEAIRIDHLTRDRLVQDKAEMTALSDSLRDRGQQTPIALVELGQGVYGLISGWRRVAALKALHAETGEPRFATVQALIRDIQTGADAYIAMVEENEIRANLSFYERARLVSEAVEIGLYPSVTRAAAGLFAHAPKAKRSKIGSFVTLHQAFGDLLRFPTAIPEKLGLALVSELGRNSGFKARLRKVLGAAPVQSAAEERKQLEAALRGPGGAKKGTKGGEAQEIASGVFLKARSGQIVLSGKSVDQALQNDLKEWLKTRG